MFQNAELTVRDYLDMLRRRRWFIAAVTLVVGALGTIPVLLSPAVYASTAKVQLRSETNLSPFGSDDLNEATRSRELLTDVAVITTREMEALVIERLGPEGPAFDGASAEVNGFSEIIDITVTASSAAGAADAANAYAEVYVELRRQVSTSALTVQESQLRSQIQELERRQAELDADLADPELSLPEIENLRLQRAQLSTQAAAYAQRADELSVDAGLREEASTVVSRAPLEATPIAPKPFRSGLIAFTFGFLIGVCFAVFLEIVRDRITDSGEMESLDPDLPVLATVPHVDVDLDDPGHRLPSRALEAFRYLRTAIQFRGLDRPIRSVLVTSSMSAEGKTTTAINLALTVAESGSRVVLIDADMRKAAVHSRLGTVNDLGLSNVLAGNAKFSDVVKFVRSDLAVVTAGHSSAAATDLLGDPRFVELIQSVQEQCDLVIVDAPPVLPVADALLASRATDGTLVVGRLGRVRRRDVKATIRRLREARIDILGLVANDSELSSGYGRYSSYYEEYGEAQPADA